MKKLVLGLAIVSALGLTGCNDNDINENPPEVKVTSKVVFDPGAGILAVPNDLLFSGSVDGTLNIPIGEGEDTSTANPYVALNALDGWSTTNPFVVNFEFQEGVTLDANSVSNAASVRIFETLMGGDAGCEAVPRGAACQVVGELVFGQDFIHQKSGDSLAIVPLKPLKAKTSYLLVLNDTLEDTNSESIAPSVSYDFASADMAKYPLGAEGSAERGLQAVINSYEGALGRHGVDLEPIIYSAAFTTQSTVDVLGTVKKLMASKVPAMLADAMAGKPSIGVMDTGMSVADIIKDRIPAALVPLYSTANFMQGSIKLPYYLGLPTATNPMAPVNENWKSLCDSGAMLAGYVAGGGTLPPVDQTSVSDITCNALGLRDIVDADGMPIIDKERHLTKYSPVPKENAMVDVAVQMTTPDVAVANMVRAGMGLPADLVEPTNGWPVVILAHGITSKKEDMLGITGILSAYGFATIAINQPLHGDNNAFGGLIPGGGRGFDLTGDGVDDINTSTVSATHYMNLASLLTTRDNLRQSTSDLLGLRLGMNFLGGFHAEGNPIKVDRTNVHFLGTSLGAIIGINFIGLTNSDLDPQVDPLFAVSTNSLSTPGVMMANFLMESGAFGDTIKSSLTLAQSPEFQGYVAQKHPDGHTETELVVAYNEFYNSLTPEQQAGLNASFSSFAFAAQTVTDSGDPANYAAMMAVTQTPTHLIEVIGDGGANLPDQVIPNTVSGAPFGGTEGAIALLGLPGVSADTMGSGAVRFTYGHHSSILDPTAKPYAPDNAAEVTAEMQSQVISFFMSNGQMISVTDETLVQ
ncbi:MAG: VolA/Pla-1 family phospholipase [Colwellia sp.]